MLQLRKQTLICARDRCSTAMSAFRIQEVSSSTRTAFCRYLNLNTYGSEPRKLEGKVAVITGGATGIGEATARLFVSNGAKVVVADIKDDLGKKLSKDLEPFADYLHCDVTQEKDVAAVVDFAVSKHGCLDVMFNNAGIGALGLGPIANLDMNDFDKTLSVNVRGVVLGVKHAARVMVPAKRGSIICTASVASVLAWGANHPYTISKHAVPGIVKSSASELGQYGIRVNCISPGGIATPLMVDIFNLFKPDITAASVAEVIQSASELKGVKLDVDDIARAALYLASEDGKYVSGHNLMVDGGYTVTRPNPFK